MTRILSALVLMGATVLSFQPVTAAAAEACRPHQEHPCKPMDKHMHAKPVVKHRMAPKFVCKPHKPCPQNHN